MHQIEKVLRMTAISAISLPIAQAASADPLYDRGASAWRAGEYSEAVEVLLDYRRTEYGRRPGVDFMLGTAGCRLAERQDWGGDVLDWMLYAYSLTLESRGVVRYERDLCRSAATASLIAAKVEEIVEARSAGMTGYGKTFYWSGDDTQPVLSYPIRRVRDMEVSEFRRRLVPLDEPERAIDVAAELVPGGRSHIEGQVLLISQAGHSESDLRSIAATLNRFLGFLESSLGISPPPYFLTVHLQSDNAGVREAALDVHGLDVSQAAVGYAFVDDLSVVGYVQGNAVGTIIHELFHLTARRDFGDIPQWLDEGIASLYEVSGRSGDIYFGIDNWRGPVLETLWDQRPTIEELIRSEWFLFDDPEQATRIEESREDLEWYNLSGASEEQAAMMATARYFAMYLEQKGLLGDVYAAVRDEGFAEVDGDAREHAVSLVETSLRKPIDEVDDDFVSWFQSGGPQRASAGISPAINKSISHETTADLLNIRSGRSTDFEIIGQLSEGAEVEVLDISNGWARINLSGAVEGYVSMDYLKPK